MSGVFLFYGEFMKIQLYILIAVSAVCACCSAGAVPKNVILCIGDGMGSEQIKAGSMYLTGETGKLDFEQFPYKAKMNVCAADSNSTDSDASATAMATGVKVNVGVISVAIPGDGKPLKTIAELFQKAGKSVGLITTTNLTHATPAAFAAHQPSRNNYAQIAEDYLLTSRPDVLLGGCLYIDCESAKAVGYEVISDVNELLAVDT